MKKYLFLLFAMIIILSGCNNELKVFEDENYYQLKSIRLGDEFDNNMGSYLGVAYCDTMSSTEELQLKILN